MIRLKVESSAYIGLMSHNLLTSENDKAEVNMIGQSLSRLHTCQIPHEPQGVVHETGFQRSFT